jgi:hypothetical protein
VLHRRAVDALGSAPLHPALSGSVGRRIGLSPAEGRELTAASMHTMTPGDVYGLHVGTCDAQAGAIASAMVILTATGYEVLVRSPDM